MRTQSTYTCCSDAIVTQVLDELGIQMSDQLANLPLAGSTVATGSKQAVQPQVRTILSC